MWNLFSYLGGSLWLCCKTEIATKRRSELVRSKIFFTYVAYCTNKFGLRGLAESLQHEVIADNIHVSLIFPPDTNTPGTVEGIELNS
ncbi:putative 3-dehydrosphinganine reductase [Lupinus albus]|uniref:Putative 3-dehydrosphinganine reductase n=1 Tax=Lupinus albus TaxID=3870 RepID=A0A6A4NR49_LUPAL|nr:putative 3-dehydrosphinganine reductase [Lupinus albus]